MLTYFATVAVSIWFGMFVQKKLVDVEARTAERNIQLLSELTMCREENKVLRFGNGNLSRQVIQLQGEVYRLRQRKCHCAEKLNDMKQRAN